MKCVMCQTEGEALDMVEEHAEANAALEAIGNWLRANTDYVGSPESDPTRFAIEVVDHLERMRGRE